MRIVPIIKAWFFFAPAADLWLLILPVAVVAIWRGQRAEWPSWRSIDGSPRMPFALSWGERLVAQHQILCCRFASLGFKCLVYCVWEEKNVSYVNRGEEEEEKRIKYTFVATPHTHALSRTYTHKYKLLMKQKQNGASVVISRGGAIPASASWRLKEPRLFEDARLRSHIPACWGTSSEAAESSSPSADSSVCTQQHSRVRNADELLFFFSYFSAWKKQQSGNLKVFPDCHVCLAVIVF